jgi:hypothetical protein
MVNYLLSYDQFRGKTPFQITGMNAVSLTAAPGFIGLKVLAVKKWKKLKRRG